MKQIILLVSLFGLLSAVSPLKAMSPRGVRAQKIQTAQAFYILQETSKKKDVTPEEISALVAEMQRKEEFLSIFPNKSTIRKDIIRGLEKKRACLRKDAARRKAQEILQPKRIILKNAPRTAQKQLFVQK